MIRIGSFNLPQVTTTADSRVEYVLGRVRRVIQITSVLNQFANREVFQSAIESLSREIERFDRGEVEISLQPGRFLRGRRKKHKVEVDEERCLAVMSLEVIADDRFEHSSLRFHSETITGSPQTFSVVSNGNWNALPQIQYNPTCPVSFTNFYDGTRQMTVIQEMNAPDVLIIDSAKRSVTLNGENVLHMTQGDFVELAPGTTHLVYGDAGSVHTASLYLFWQDRWV
jgi:phage-related protein